jgi:hypothetical protein
MNPTPSNLIRWSGLAAVVAGVIFAGIQPIHPADVVESVTTTAWAIITPLKTAMCMLFLLGITGTYARQAEKAGWLGLAGFLLLIVSWWLQMAFVFAEAFILPPLAAAAPEFVDGALGISYGPVATWSQRTARTPRACCACNTRATSPTSSVAPSPSPTSASRKVACTTLPEELRHRRDIVQCAALLEDTQQHGDSLRADQRASDESQHRHLSWHQA